MGFTNSPLVAYTKLSPNYSGLRTHRIDRITPHCVVGQCTVECLGDWFYRTSTQASSNYGIDKNGRVGMYVEEKNRSWCTSSNANDQRAITIECASDKVEPYIMYELVYVEKLCSIIERWKLTKYDVKDSGSSDVVVKYYRVRKDWKDAASQLGAYTVLDNAKAMAEKHEGYTVYDWNGKAVYGAEVDGGKNSVAEFSNADCPFMVKVDIDDLNIRKGAGTNTAKIGRYTGKGVFTIIQVKSGSGSTLGWGKLKSGAGWISLDYCVRIN